MQFYITPQRARAIWQEYLDRRAIEERNKLEMAKRVLTWYNDLESEVSQHFSKALECSAAKRCRLAADDFSSCSPYSSSSLEFYTDDYPGCGQPLPLPSLFPPLSHLPPLTMTYPDYYHYTDEVDPFISDYSTDEDDHCEREIFYKTEGDYESLQFAEPHSPSHPHQGHNPHTLTHCDLPCGTDDFVSLSVAENTCRTLFHTPADPTLLTHTLDPASCDSSSLPHTEPDSLFNCDSEVFYTCQRPLEPAQENTSLSVSHTPTISGETVCDSLNLSLDWGVYASDDVAESEDDIIDNIRLDWTEEEMKELKTIVV